MRGYSTERITAGPKPNYGLGIWIHSLHWWIGMDYGETIDLTMTNHERKRCVQIGCGCSFLGQ